MHDEQLQACQPQNAAAPLRIDVGNVGARFYKQSASHVITDGRSSSLLAVITPGLRPILLIVGFV
jgi:hypothetical protein